MKKIIILIILIWQNVLPVLAQEPLNFNIKNSCSYYGDSLPKGTIYTFSSTPEANGIIKRIMDAVGLEPNFVVMAANVPNAAATIDSLTGKRYILYSQSFISNIETAAGTDWAGISILAHEIGHHLNGHTLVRRNKTQDQCHKEELQADKFSGFVCYKLGATLTQAQIAMSISGSDLPSATHPAKSARLEAIAVGWSNAKSNGPSPTTVSTQPIPSPGNSGNNNPGKSSGNSGSIDEECVTNNTGEYSFTNQTTKKITVRIYKMSDYGSVATPMTLAPGETKAFYDLPAVAYGYNIEEEWGNRPYGSPQPYSAKGEIKVERCKNKTFEIR